MFPLRNIILFVFIFHVLSVFAQNDCTYSINGKVIDEHDASALSYATIYILENGMGTVSDANGNYSLGGLCAGRYTLRCSHLGCEDVIDTLVVEGDIEWNFYPEHHLEELSSAVVQGEYKEEETSQSVDKLEYNDLLELKGQNLGNSLKEIPGVSSLNTGNNISKPVIHGMHSNRVLILNNGIRHEGQQWGNEHAPEIDPSIAGEMSVVKGANSLRYGPDAIAGVILVNPRPLRNYNGVGGEVSMTGATNGRQGNISAMLEGNHGAAEAWRWRLQGSLKRGGNIRAPDYYLDNTGVGEYNFSWALGYLKSQFGAEVFYSQFNSDIGIFSGSHIGNLTDLENAFKSDEALKSAEFSYEIGRPWQHIEHEMFKARTYYHFNESSKLELTYARQYNLRQEYDKDRPLNDSLAGLDLPALQFEITTHTTDLVYKQGGIKPWRFTAGMSGLYQVNTYEGRFFIPNFYKYGLGVYALERWLPESSKWEFEAGIRYDYIIQEVFIWKGDELQEPIHNYNNVSGNIGAIYEVMRGFDFRANAGIAWRPPNVNEMYSNGLHHGSAAVEIGDTSLTEERAYNFSVSANMERTRWFANLSLYYNYIEDYIYLKPIQPPTLTIRGAFPTFMFSQVDATISGLDASLGYNIRTRLSFSLKASIVRAFNRTANEYLVLIPPDRFEYGIRYSFNEGKKIYEPFVGLSLTQVLEQIRVPENSDYVPPPPAYALLGLRAGMDVMIGRQRLQMILRIDNMLNHKYRDYMNRWRYFADDMGRNVSLSITLPLNFKPMNKIVPIENGQSN